MCGRSAKHAFCQLRFACLFVFCWVRCIVFSVFVLHISTFIFLTAVWKECKICVLAISSLIVFFKTYFFSFALPYFHILKSAFSPSPLSRWSWRCATRWKTVTEYRSNLFQKSIQEKCKMKVKSFFLRQWNMDQIYFKSVSKKNEGKI